MFVILFNVRACRRLVYNASIGRIPFSSVSSTTLNWLLQLANGVILVFQPAPSPFVPFAPARPLQEITWAAQVESTSLGLNKIEELEWNCFGFPALISLVVGIHLGLRP